MYIRRIDGAKPMSLKAIGKTFLFTFFSETVGGKFIDRNSGVIILTNQDMSDQGKMARWARVEEVGPSVSAFNKGDIVLIEALQWTTEVRFEGKSYWKSDEDKVIAIGLDESVTFAY
jgi:hypothetical protein